MWTPKISHVAAQNQWQWHEILVVLAKFRAWGDLKLLNDLGIFTKNIEDLMSWLDLMVLYIVKCFRLDEGLEKRDCISILGVWRVKIRVTYTEWTWFLKIKFTTWKEGNWDHATMCPSFDSTLGEYFFWSWKNCKIALACAHEPCDSYRYHEDSKFLLLICKNVSMSLFYGYV